MRSPIEAVPLGWLVLDGLLQEDPSVAGHLARQQPVKGSCQQRDCRRHCELDLERLAKRGFGSLPVKEACRFLRCQSLTGCGLDFVADPRFGLPMSALIGRSHVRLRIKCAHCGFYRVAGVEAVAAKLKAEHPDTETRMITEIATRIKGPCGQCRKRAWTVDVLWPDPNSEGARRGSR